MRALVSPCARSRHLRMNGKTIRRFISIGLIIIMAVIFTLTTDTFLIFRNITNMLKDSAYLGIIALGMSFVIIGGGIDLSVGGIACVVGLLSVRMSVVGIPGIVIVPLAILLGVFCGFINALLVSRLHLTGFVATLASGFVYSGLALILAFRERKVITSVEIPRWSSLRTFGGSVGDVQIITIVWVVLSIVAFFIFTRSNFGLHTYSIGSNEKSAKMSGVNTDMVRSVGHMVCGGCAGLAVVLQAALNGSSPLNIGTGYEFQAIAACVVGGVVLGGGKGDSISALCGSLFLIMLMNGLYKYGLATSWEYILQGGIILLATGFDSIFSKITTKRLLSHTRRLGGEQA